MEKKILNKTYRSLAVAAMSVALTACNADFLDTQPSDRVGTDLVWSTYNMADAVVNGAYERFYWEHQGECADWQNFDAATDVCDLDANWGGYDWARGRCNASYWGFNDWWKRLYEEIYRTSNVINNLDKCEAMAASERARDIAECKFLRAWAYYRANVLWRGVPLYTEPVEYGEDTKPRSSADEIWAQIVKDCSEAIAEQNLPDKYAPSDRNYGRVTKACAYYLRGQVYLWLKDWDKAANDFRAITTMGFQLFPDYKNMFKAANERNDEYIFQYQYTDEDGMGSLLGRTHGNRNTYTADGFGCWNNLIPNPYFVDTYEYADGKPFNMDEVFPGYSKMEPKARSVFFLRDGLDPNSPNEKLKAGYQQMVNYGSDMSQYEVDGNEARILQVYQNRDPRMLMNGALISLAEALNEQGNTTEAVKYINMVRARIPGLALLNSNEFTQVKGQDDMRQRIRNEYGWELCGEGQLYWKQLRWDTWLDRKVGTNRTSVSDPSQLNGANGMTEIWGTKRYTNNYIGEHVKLFAVPQGEIERNPNLTQNPGW